MVRYLVLFVLSARLMAGPTFDGNKKLDKKAAQVSKSLSSNDVSQIYNRLRVEGATFRAFNLFLPDFVLESKAREQQKLALDMRRVLERDLAISGGFSLLAMPTGGANESLIKQKGGEGISRISLSFTKDKISVQLEHKNLITGQINKKYFASSKQAFRSLSHLLASSIFSNFVGSEDLFQLQIAAVKRVKNENQIVLFDFDGYNEKAVSSGPWTKATPFFSPEGKNILYTVITKQGQGIVEQEVGSKTLQFRIKKTGLNLDPRILPDNSGIIATLSFGKSANIYRANRSGHDLINITEPLGLNLSPALSADGKLLVFVSTRSGSPQIYEQALVKPGEKIPSAKRLTFQGRYNQTPQYSPDAKYVAFTGRDENKVFDLFLLERSSGHVTRITENQGRNQEPFFSPSGRYIVFVSEREGRKTGDLYLATLNGHHQYRLTTDGGYLSPVIRPLKN